MGRTRAIGGRISGIMFAASLSGAASAATARNDGFKTLRQSLAYERAVVDTAKQSNAYKAFVCDAAKLTLQAPLYTLKKPVFDKKGKAITGDWAERLLIQGCGPTHALNVLVHVRKPGSITTEPLLPGLTNASLQLQVDAISFAFDAARVDRKGCHPIYVLDTDFKAFAKQPDPTVLLQPWVEIWTVVQCDKRTAVTMTFVPEKTGTAIGAKADP